MNSSPPLGSYPSCGAVGLCGLAGEAVPVRLGQLVSLQEDCRWHVLSTLRGTYGHSVPARMAVLFAHFGRLLES